MGVNSPHPKAVLCMDIDGTLIDADEQVHPQDIQVLQHFPPEVQPILTTGRILHSAKGVLQENGLFKQPCLPLPGVFMNGGAAYLPQEQLCIEHAFAQNARQALLQLSQAFPNSAFTFFSASEVHLVNPTPFAQHISRLHYLDARETAPKDLPERIIKVMVLEEDPQILNQIKAHTENWEAEMAFSLPYAYEINPPGITKANTLTRLLAVLGLKKLPIYIVGDAENDLSLFRLARRSFAPDTAHPTVLHQADQIIPRGANGLLEPILNQVL